MYPSYFSAAQALGMFPLFALALNTLTSTTGDRSYWIGANRVGSEPSIFNSPPLILPEWHHSPATRSQKQNRNNGIILSVSGTLIVSREVRFPKTWITRTVPLKNGCVCKRHAEPIKVLVSFPAVNFHQDSLDFFHSPNG